MKKAAMGTIFLALIASGWARADNDYSEGAAKVKIIVETKVRERAGKDKDWKEVVDWLEDKNNWEKMFQRMDEQLGIFREDGMPISATLQFQNRYPAQAQGRANHGTGEMEISVPALVQFAGVLNKQGPNVTIAHVTEMFVTHELTHCFQQSPSGEKVIEAWPLWLIEGMACFAAEDDLQDGQLSLLAQTGINDLDSLKGPDAYPRGRIFFKYVHEEYGADRVKELVALLLEKTGYQEAIEKITEKEWDDFKGEELEWAKTFAKSKGL